MTSLPSSLSSPRSKRSFVALAALILSTSAVAQERRLTPEMLWDLGRVGDPQVSPDGRFVLYHLRSYELASNRGRTGLRRLERETGEDLALLEGRSVSNARFSPDGSRIAFLSASTEGGHVGTSQIWIASVDGDDARCVTDHPGGVSNLAWSPDGTKFSFTATVRLDPSLVEQHPDLPLADARIYDDLMVRHWDAWKDGTHSHLFVVPADGSEPARDLMAGMRVDTPLAPFGGGEQITWAPDSAGLVYTAKIADAPEFSTNSDLFWVKLDGGAHINVTRGFGGYDIEPRFAPGGKWLAWGSMERNGYESDQNRLFVRAWPPGPEPVRVDAWDGTVGSFCWLPDASGFLVEADWRGTHQVFRLELEGGGIPSPVTEGRWHFASAVPLPDGTGFVALRQRTEWPSELVEVAFGDEPGEGVARTDANGDLLAGLDLPQVEERWFDATDGKRIHSWVIKPPGFDPKKRYPMLLYCQGGPQSQVGQWFSYRWNFHLMAARGYVVLAVNRRGLPGFGTEWNEAISRDWGGQAMQDLLSATDAMVAEPFIDPKRVGAVGASYGGYTVYWLMGHDQPDRFAAMIAHCGVFNLESMYLSTEELFFANWDLGGPFWGDERTRADYERFSPHRFLQDWDTPLLVIHGQQDFRVPLEQGLQAFTGAQVRGVPSRFVYFPGESHWVLSPQNGVLWQRLFFDWLDRHLAAKKR